MIHTCRVAVLCTVLLLSGCSVPEHWTFTEEVRLNDGRVVQVSRDAKRNNVWPRMGEGGYHAVVSQRLVASSIGVDVVLTGLGEEGGLELSTVFSIGIVDGHPVLVGNSARTHKLLDYCKVHPEAFNAEFYQKVGEHWQLVTQSEILLDTLSANLLQDLSWDQKLGKPKTLDAKAKEEREKRNFQNPPSLRDFLSKKSFGKCLDLLRANNVPGFESR